MNTVVRGGLAGIAATIPMTAAIAIGGGFRHGRTPPPEEIGDTLARRAEIRDNLPGPAFTMGWLMGHLGYGGACGVLYGRLREYIPGSAVGSGFAYGTLVWAVSYGALMPALHLYPPPHRQSARRSVLMLAAHAVYGAALGMGEKMITSGRNPLA